MFVVIFFFCKQMLGYCLGGSLAKRQEIQCGIGVCRNFQNSFHNIDQEKKNIIFFLSFLGVGPEREKGMERVYDWAKNSTLLVVLR